MDAIREYTERAILTKEIEDTCTRAALYSQHGVQEGMDVKRSSSAPTDYPAILSPLQLHGS